MAAWSVRDRPRPASRGRGGGRGGPVQHQVHDHLASDDLLGVEELPVSARPHLINHRWLKVDEDSPRHVLAGASLGEEGLVAGQLAVGSDAVLEAVELLAGVAHLAASPAHIDGEHSRMVSH